ncbi:MFS transporter [Pontixanthobacter aestiaquae]|uniref:MFS transporter n=1 Tax=Pontixanthobacter aestiaquae TaxID=1509367 RepID=A0A844Z5D6_9SPHN|nr:MFS transporter [Pontixanthobacter aestiaquae]MDN3645129.1 MFS transporter [Pontixanthobacter aestiaquae]MXO83871.1 MFS transporter [Pontixanthobacter aestiaquae]
MADAAAKGKPGWRVVLTALRQRKTAYMLLFGFAAGLPYALVLGTLYAWLSDSGEIDLETMGVFSLVGLAYAFKFLWSPALDRVDIPVLKKLGKRKQWIVTAQLLIGAALTSLSFIAPTNETIGIFSLLAGLAAFASATQDVVIDAWRVDVADDVATIDILSTVYQMGYRIAALVGGAFALFLAERTDWPTVYLSMGALMLIVGFAGLWAPDADATALEATGDEDSADPYGLRKSGQLVPGLRAWSLAAVGVLWGWALITVGVFMVRSLSSNPDTRPDSVEFISTMGPLIVVATVVVPSIIAAWLVRQERNGTNLLTEAAPAKTSADRAMDHLYRALVLPLTDLIGRLGWAMIIVIALVLTYRITDAIWGSFAYPFYLGELQYTKDEVAVASKFFGVGALLVGLALGGYLLTAIGRMLTLTLGAFFAAVTNLLYADLARGGAVMQAVADNSGFTWLVSQMGGDPALAKLMMAIAGENIAVGVAGAAFVAYLSSIVSKGYSAVQYALLSSLTLLVGTLGRGALGQMIEERGYFDVFILTTLIGMFAVVLCIVEWIRQARLGKAAGVVAPEVAATQKAS